MNFQPNFTSNYQLNTTTNNNNTTANNNNTTNNPDDPLNILNNIYQSYNPNSPNYKFSYVFYNIVPKAVNNNNFSGEEWEKLFINDRLMLVKLNKEQIVERKAKQHTLLKKLNESKYTFQTQIETLKHKKLAIGSKLKLVIDKYRIYSQYKTRLPQSSQNPHFSDHYQSRDRLICTDPGECITHLMGIKKNLVNFEKKIDDDLKMVEKRSYSFNDLF